jgi:hypothetical protein
MKPPTSEDSRILGVELFNFFKVVKPWAVIERMERINTDGFLRLYNSLRRSSNHS